MSGYIAIAIDTPLRKLFDYRPPAGNDADALQPGERLWVPFGKRRTVGILVAHRQHSELAENKIRRAFEVIEGGPVFEPALLDLLLWSADYYRHPVGEVLAAALPVPLRKGAPLHSIEYFWRLTQAGEQDALASLPPRATRLLAFVTALLANPRGTGQDAGTLNAMLPGWRDAARTLLKRGYVEQIEHIAAITLPASSAVQQGPALSAAQQAAIDRIESTLGSFATLLLDGVTGSGKTEVYLRAIATVLAQGRQALVLVPEIALTPQLTQRFAERFATPLAVLHSSLNDTERLAAWRSARDGSAGVVIGTRSAVFAPLARPGLIVVDEEHDPSYKQQEGFRYSARDLAIARAQRHAIPVVLGSATPSLESLARLKRTGARARSEHLVLPQRAGNATPPPISVIDLRQHAATQGLSTPSMLAIRRHLDEGGQVLLYLNRRGYAPALFCPECGWSAPCPRCDARLTVHRRESRLVCHHCATEQPIPATCPVCLSPAKPVGQGTERIEETLGDLFPGVPLVRIDRDNIRRKGELDAAMERIHSGAVRLLVGTQMLTKGHHFPDVTLVIVMNADQGLFSTDFRASERLAQTIIQVAGRAGRAARPGEVLIQSEYPEHPLLQQLLTGGYPAFAAAALQERELAGWPPFSRLALLRADAATEQPPLSFLATARALAHSSSRALTVLGPAPAPMQRRGDRFRAQLLLQAATPAVLQSFLASWIPCLDELPEARKVRWSVDVDPLELF
jgi:primosomal protein N' (replication factor Y) (superfamily II helicase)